MSRRARRAGCLVFGVVWTLFMITAVVGNAMGDCGEPDYAQCEERRTHQNRVIFGGGLVVLLAAGLLFYRREMKDDGF